MNLLKRYAVPVACAMTVLVMTACSSTKDERREPTPLTEFKPVLNVQQAWKSSVGKAGRYLFSPVAVGNVVYAAGANGSVAKIDAQTGKDIWRIKVGSDLSAGVGSDGTLTAVGGLKGEVYVLGEDGKPVRLTMGSYGLGVSRLVAVIAEQQHDELGLRWPSEVSPFDVHLVIANKDAEARAGATALATDLDRLGIEVLLDDRQASPGVKFKDAELLGVPWIVVVGRGWADGKVELRNRFSGETRELTAGPGLATDITVAVAS